MTAPLRVLYDDEAFIRHTRSGISRYLAELIGEYRTDPALGVDPSTPYRWVANAHLHDRDPRRFTRIPLPGSRRVPVLERLNRRRARSGGARPDVVHHSLYEPDALERWDGRVRVTNVYDFTFERLPHVFPVAGPELERKRHFLDACDGLLAISRSTLADLREFHPDLDKPVAVTPLGAGPEFFAPQPVAIRDLPERYLLLVSNRHVHKNVDLLLRAFAELARTDADLRLVLCGAGLPEETGRLAELGITARTVRMRVSDRQLPWLYSRAEAFVFPSRYEGFGLPVVEAMAAGCPVVASDIPVMHEVGDDAVRYVGCDDVDGLVEVLRRLRADAAERGRMVEAGRRRAGEFTWRRTAEATARAYREFSA